MTTITPVSSTQTTASQTQTTALASEDESSSGLTADFDTFLQLLTTQLRNQDPLNPLDSSEFVAQLATFSAVEQQTLTNQRLEELISLSGPGSDLTQAADWIGLEVAAPGPGIKSGNNSILFEFPTRDAATSTVVVIRNDAGQAVATKTVNPTDTSLSWDGTLTEGGLAADGAYTAEITYFNGEEQLDTIVASVFSTVKEVRLENNTPVLLLQNGSQVEVDSLSAARSGDA